MIRWYILKTLLHKEALRHATNRGGLALAGLLVTASLLLAALNPASEQDKPTSLIGGVHHCIIFYDEENEWLVHMRDHLQPNLKTNVLFSPIGNAKKIEYPTGTGGFEILVKPDTTQGQKFKVNVRYPEGDRAGMAVYENWFWRETYRYFYNKSVKEFQRRGQPLPDALAIRQLDDDIWSQRIALQELEKLANHSSNPSLTTIPGIELNEGMLRGGALDLRAAIATALVMFSLCFTCVYLMPSLTCEERERGLLLAQALSPASAAEILAAKFFFYPAFGMVLATLLAGIHNPHVLGRPFFWMALVALSVGTLGIGMTIACLAKTQRAASLGALCYMLAVALILLVCQQNNIGYLPFLSLEYHAPNILHATLTNQIRSEHWFNLSIATVLAGCWAMIAVFLFRKRGWQ